MRREKLRTLVLYLLAAVAILVPIVAAVWQAGHQSLLRQERRAASFATEILARSDRITDQMRQAIAELGDAHAADPCSDRNLALMRALILRSNLLIDVGYLKDDVLLCSSFGREPQPLGPPTYTSALGYVVRVGARHPLAPDAHILVVSDPGTNYAVLISPTLATDAMPEESNLVLGVMSVQRKQMLTLRGPFRPEWLAKIGGSPAGTFYDGASVVAWQRSQLGDYLAFAAIGRDRIAEDQRRSVMVLLPIGAAAAALLVFVMVRLARLQASMPRLLRSAIRRGELFLVYQPIVNLGTGAWVGAEALLRWRRPGGELISPELFIPIAESRQLMGRITEAVMRIFERDAAALLRQRSDFHISLNLSATDICSPDIVDRLVAMSARMRIPAASLQVEATERVFMNVEASRRNIRQLRAAGIVVAIDDFGTGYSSLSYLHNLEVDRLKIDRSFIDTIGTEAVTSQVVRHIIEMAKSLNMQMIAEGVETEAQAQFLRTHGVQYGQGWLYSRPLSMEQLTKKLEAAAPSRGSD
jgi:sensor c-di-GMP phosphodiesterase-like protein